MNKLEYCFVFLCYSQHKPKALEFCVLKQSMIKIPSYTKVSVWEQPMCFEGIILKKPVLPQRTNLFKAEMSSERIPNPIDEGNS
jgi:hypothetical protein